LSQRLNQRMSRVATADFFNTIGNNRTCREPEMPRTRYAAK
jgi:hypothetical protein